MNETCCLCGRPITGYGHNAQPLADGRCCDDCNAKVIKERLNRFVKELELEEKENCSKEKK